MAKSARAGVQRTALLGSHKPTSGEVNRLQRNHVSSAVSGNCGPGSCDQYKIVSGQWGCGCLDEKGEFINTSLAVVDTSVPCKRYQNAWFNCNGDPEYDCYNQILDESNSFNCPGAPPPASPTPTPCPVTNAGNCPSGIVVDPCTWDNPEGIDDG
jgi:hypothetical protein